MFSGWGDDHKGMTGSELECLAQGVVVVSREGSSRSSSSSSSSRSSSSGCVVVVEEPYRDRDIERR